MPTVPEALIGPPLAGLEHIQFGHFSDNNRTPTQKEYWTEAQSLFEAKKYTESLQVFLQYLFDKKEAAVAWHTTDDGILHFELSQGTRLISGTFDGRFLHAAAPLARTRKAGTAVMRRLLELNYELRYTSVGMSSDGIFYLVFDTDAETASPHKLFAGLEELAIKADRQDDSLLTDFKDLEVVGEAIIEPLSEQELKTKELAFRNWIQHALQMADTFDVDTYAGAIAELYLTTIYRLDFLLSPDGRLMLEIERISGLYWRQKDKAVVLRNREIKAALEQLLQWPSEDLRQCLHRTRSTFSLTDNPQPDKMRDHITGSLRSSETYEARHQKQLAACLLEYGPLYNLYLYSMPDVIRDLSIVLFAVWHPRYFNDLGLEKPFYDIQTHKLSEKHIKDTVQALIKPWKETFPSLAFDLSKVSFRSRYEFGRSYAAQLAQVIIQ